MSEDYDASQHPEWQDYVETTPALSYVDTSSKPSSASPLPQSPSQSDQQPAARTEIDDLAARHQLGKVQKEYKNDVSTNMTVGISFCMLGLLCFLPFILDVFVQLGYVSGLRLISIGGLGFLGYGINRITVAINNIGANALNHNPRCYLCSRGVISIKGKRAQAIRWDQIRGVQKIYAPSTSNIPQQYILYPQGDEEPVVLDRVSTGFWILGRQIEREVVRHLLPKALATYKAGRTLNFGALNATSQGLNLEGTTKNLPWEKLGYFRNYRRYLIIKERGTLATWKNLEVSEIINLCVLLPLLEQIRHVYQLNGSVKGSGQRSLSYQPPVNEASQQSEWQEYE